MFHGNRSRSCSWLRTCHFRGSSGSARTRCCRGACGGGAANARTLVDFLLELRNPAELVEGLHVVNLQQFAFLQRLHVFDGDVDAVDVAQNASSQFFDGLRKTLDLADGAAKQFVEAVAKGHIVGGDRGEHSGMMERTSKRQLELAHARQNSGADQRIEVNESLRV